MPYSTHRSISLNAIRPFVSDALVQHAVMRSIGEVAPEAVLAEVKNRTWIREGHRHEAVISTPAVLKEEQWMLKTARMGLGT